MSDRIVKIPELTVALESSGATVSVELRARQPTIEIELGASGEKYPDYPGPYEVTPRVEAQSLSTREQVMREDVIVHAIPYFETTNLSGGYTAIIGG